MFEILLIIFNLVFSVMNLWFGFNSTPLDWFSINLGFLNIVAAYVVWVTGDL